jgi:histidinol-phosphate aminotransferase
MPELSLLELCRPELAELSPYRPESGEYRMRLDANEAPPLLSPEAKAKLAEVAAATAWERYPDAQATELRAAIARRAGVTPEEILVGVGSDEIISLLVTVLARPRRAEDVPTLITTTPTFVMYRMAARVRGQRVLEVPLDQAWDLAESSLLRALEMSPPNLLFIASPNNPTGTCPSRDRLERVIQAAEGALVVIDEAYVDYAGESCLDLYRRYPHVAVMRTLSKVGFAALRVGWLMARPEICAELDKARLPFNVCSPSQRLATCVLDELGGELERIRRSVIEERERLCRELAGLPGISVTPSEGNFVWLASERPAAEITRALAERGVLVRSFHQRGGRLAHQLRVTIGSRAQMDGFVEALSEIVQ